ncbi:DUF3021 domain-containing protein [Bacillus sp. FJAT-42315]|uniref:DUF3021 domain-containing protein n=1 Tax=Bacillus sp. FJAT-42315 TaxID=2014077 RepID=UPI000C241785|nr:DUF3021 domain-containing protein [Bacillus sp. FJAT-42315]
MKILRMMIIGLLISLSSSYTLMTISVLSIPDAVMTGPDLLKQLVLAAVLGIVIGLLSLIFESESLSFPIQLIIHFIALTVCILTAGYVGDWYDVTQVSTIMFVLISELIIYGLTWGILHVLTKRDIDMLNEKIQKRKEERR